MKSDRTVLRWYRRINRRFFDGACPEKVCVRYARPGEEKREIEQEYFGWADKKGNETWATHEKHCPRCTHDYEIVLDETANWITVLSTLAHEMIHLDTAM